MKTTKIFKSGNSQAVRLPKEFQFQSDEVEILRTKEGEVIIREIPHDLSEAFKLLTQLPDDFLAEGRKDLPPQDRSF